MANRWETMETVTDFFSGSKITTDGDCSHDFSFLNVEIYANFFTLLLHFHQEVLQFLFAFCHKGGVICISEVIDISHSFQREWAAFLGSWCPLPAFRSCFVEVAQHSNDPLMNLRGRKWSPHPIPCHLGLPL